MLVDRRTYYQRVEPSRQLDDASLTAAGDQAADVLNDAIADDR